MAFQDLTILLPCHSLEDFPLHHEGEDAAGLLAAWTALWHPALVAAAGKMPGWARADDPPSDLAGRLLIVPQVSEAILLAGWPQRAAGEGATVIRHSADRQQLIDQALAALGTPADAVPADAMPADAMPADAVAADAVAAIDAELAGDFLALGYAYLQEELLTRQMRYISHLDEVHFGREVVAAAQAAAAGQNDSAREHLQNCFDVLTESREHVYPAEAYLVDLTLVAPTTVGPSLRRELAAASASSLLISADTLRQMAEKEPESLAALRSAMERSAVTLVGGELAERELPLLPPETVLGEFTEASRTYRQLLGRAPRSTAAGDSACPPCCRKCFRGWASAAPCTSRSTRGNSPAPNRPRPPGRAWTAPRWRPSRACPSTSISQPASSACARRSARPWTWITWRRSSSRTGPASRAPGTTTCGELPVMPRCWASSSRWTNTSSPPPRRGQRPAFAPTSTARPTCVRRSSAGKRIRSPRWPTLTGKA